MPTLPLLPALAVVLIIVDIVFVASWSGALALIGALLLLEPMFLRDQRVGRRKWLDRSLLPVGTLVRLPAAFGTLSRVRRYLLVLFGLFFVLRAVMLAVELEADDTTRAALATAIRLYDAALVVTALMLVVLTEQLHRLGRFALLLAHRPTILLVTSFAVIIGIGALLLMLPIAVHDPRDISFVDSLFTITSGVCVTGLAANDFAAVYTDFGHVVTLVGIQIGGIGMMTIAALAATFGRGSLERHAGYSATFEAKKSGRAAHARPDHRVLHVRDRSPRHPLLVGPLERRRLAGRRQRAVARALPRDLGLLQRRLLTVLQQPDPLPG